MPGQANNVLRSASNPSPLASPNVPISNNTVRLTSLAAAGLKDSSVWVFSIDSKRSTIQVHTYDGSSRNWTDRGALQNVIHKPRLNNSLAAVSWTEITTSGTKQRVN